jgi:hypothetical protein
MRCTRVWLPPILLPTKKKLAVACFCSNVVNTSGVVIAFGPSSNVSAIHGWLVQSVRGPTHASCFGCMPGCRRRFGCGGCSGCNCEDGVGTTTARVLNCSVLLASRNCGPLTCVTTLNASLGRVDVPTKSRVVTSRTVICVSQVAATACSFRLITF